MGVWIEIISSTVLYMGGFPVTPCVGVWIEMDSKTSGVVVVTSLPAWECGVKYILIEVKVDCGMSLPAWECGLKSVNRL